MLQVTICVYKQSGERKKKEFGVGKFIGRVSSLWTSDCPFFFVLRPSETPERVVSVVSRCETRHHMSGPRLFYESRAETLDACCVDVGIVRKRTGYRRRGGRN
jgi:hypothetical protein